jgi:ABC-type Na+ efflux pump permease subunit
MILLLGVPLGVLFDKLLIHFGWKISDIFHYVFLVTITIYPVVAGLTVFLSERKDRAFEYLFSLPLSRLEAIRYKIAPRFLFLLLLIIASIFFSTFKNTSINAFNLIVVFFISAFMSISVTSFLIGAVLVILIFTAYYLSSIYIYLIYIGWNHSKYNAFSTGVLLSDLVVAALLLIPIGTAFWMTFKNLDIRPLKLQLKFYYYILVPTISAFYAFIILVVKKFIERS